jgi:hypothetical protein
MAGVPIRTIQELMGHETMDMTLKYAHLTEGHQREAMDKLQHQLQRISNTPRSGTKSSSRISHFPAHAGNGGDKTDK